MQTKHVLTIFVLSFFVITGCGPDPNLGQVSGTVTYKGQPMIGATVSYRPIDSSGVLAVGTTDSAGKYILAAPSPKGVVQGAYAGKYQILISKLEITQSPATKLYSEGKITYDELQSRGGFGTPRSKELLPKKYTDAKTSGLEADVKAQTENVFDFDLK